MSPRLRVRNWTKFQHYSKRNPPWIKLATDTFQNYEFSILSNDAKLLAICIWTLATRSDDGSVPGDLGYITDLGRLGEGLKQEHLEELVKSGFLERVEPMLAHLDQKASSETETETETEENMPILNNAAYPAEFEAFWAVAESNRAKGSKLNALKAWKKGGSPPSQLLIEKWRSYRLSIGDSYTKDVSTWMNIPGWLEDYEPRKLALVSAPNSPYCEWHSNGNRNKVSFRPRPTCPECKHVAALKAPVRVSEPIDAGAAIRERKEAAERFLREKEADAMAAKAES
jgi:hypothetical protein